MATAPRAARGTSSCASSDARWPGWVTVRAVSVRSTGGGVTGAWRRPASTGQLALLVVLGVVTVLFICGGGALGLYLIGGGSNASAQSGPTASGSARPATGSAPPTASPVNPAAIVQGECVANDGTEDVPKLRLASCGPGAFLVVGRFDGTDDVHRCDSVAGATHNFFYRTDPANLSFVLCLKRQ